MHPLAYAVGNSWDSSFPFSSNRCLRTRTLFPLFSSMVSLMDRQISFLIKILPVFGVVYILSVYCSICIQELFLSKSKLIVRTNTHDLRITTGCIFAKAVHNGNPESNGMSFRARHKLARKLQHQNFSFGEAVLHTANPKEKRNSRIVCFCSFHTKYHVHNRYVFLN